MINSKWLASLAVGLALALSASAKGGDAEPGNQPLRLRVLSYNIHHGEGVDRKLDLPRIAENQPALLAGDLNALPDSQTLSVLETAWTRASRDVLFTFPAEQPVRQIDFILFRPASRWRPIEIRVLEDGVASDHRPILGVLELLPEDADQAGEP